MNLIHAVIFFIHRSPMANYINNNKKACYHMQENPESL